MRFWLLILIVPSLALAEEKSQEIPNELFIRALDWMKSENPEHRKAAYSTLQILNEAALPKFQTALFTAKTHHEKELSKVLSSPQSKDFKKLEPILEELASERSRGYDLIKIDYKKDPSEIKMLKTEVEGVSSLFKKASRMADADFTALDKKLTEVATAIVELTDELARIENHHDGNEFEPDDSPLETRRKEVIEESFDGERYLKFQDARAALQGEIAAIEAAAKHNSASSWASSSQKDFAHLLNQERGLMGLRPLHLEEKLSTAATGHSQDMESMGFFAHQSPVEGKETPKKRADEAGYGGGWSGENIYLGSSSHAAAFDAWFGSDGHRFIMYAKGPSELGIGPVGRHWTMMTGRGR